MRSVSVSSPFSTTQALNGDSVMPAVRSVGPNTSWIRRCGPHSAPAITRPCPSRYLVPACITRSAPSASGRCSAGEQKVLSTVSSAPASCAMSASAAMSQTSVSGLVGVSANSSFVRRPDRGAPFGQIGLRHEAGVDAELGELLGEQADRRAEHRARAHHVVAGLQQAHHQQQDRAHAGGGGHGGLGTFHRRQPRFQAAHRGVAGAPVGEVLHLGKAPRRGLGIGLHEGAGQEQPLAVLAMLAGRQRGAHGQRLGAQAVGKPGARQAGGLVVAVGHRGLKVNRRCAAPAGCDRRQRLRRRRGPRCAAPRWRRTPPPRCRR